MELRSISAELLSLRLRLLIGDSDQCTTDHRCDPGDPVFRSNTGPSEDEEPERFEQDDEQEPPQPSFRRDRFRAVPSAFLAEMVDRR